jgi:LysR family transcriptional regulator, low CO2-responsive transcriptional regulator
VPDRQSGGNKTAHCFQTKYELLSYMPEPLDSRQLRAFASLARTGSFTQTARELRLSQSAISHSMKALEQEVRCRLLDRLGKTVILTQAGEQLLAHTERILAEMTAARERLGELGKWGHGRLRVCASTTACQYILPAVLREFKESFPQCVIQIEPGDTPAALELLRRNRIDLALSLEPKTDSGFEFRPLFEDELQFMVSPSHAWARAGRVERSEIVRQKFILYTKTSYLYEMIEKYFYSEKMVLPTSIELGNMEAIKELVKLGLGISILAPWVAQKELAEGSLCALPLGKRKLKRRWGVLLRRGQRLTLAPETFIGLCQAVVENFRVSE